jgi:hypothetical protein
VFLEDARICGSFPTRETNLEIWVELPILMIQKTITAQLMPLFISSIQSTPSLQVTPPIQSTSAAPPIQSTSAASPIEVASEPTSEPQVEQVVPNVEVAPNIEVVPNVEVENLFEAP